MSKREKIKLPRSEFKLHPLVVGLQRVCVRHDTSMRQIARVYLGVTQQALDEWLHAARSDRDFLVPAARVPSISKLTRIAPYHFNPVLWPNPKWRF